MSDTTRLHLRRADEEMSVTAIGRPGWIRVSHWRSETGPRGLRLIPTGWPQTVEIKEVDTALSEGWKVVPSVRFEGDETGAFLAAVAAGKAEPLLMDDAE